MDRPPLVAQGPSTRNDCRGTAGHKVPAPQHTALHLHNAPCPDGLGVLGKEMPVSITGLGERRSRDCWKGAQDPGS